MLVALASLFQNPVSAVVLLPLYAQMESHAGRLCGFCVGFEGVWENVKGDDGDEGEGKGREKELIAER